MFKGFDKSTVPQTAEEVLKHCGKLDAKTAKWIKGLFRTYIFINKDADYGICSACGKEISRKGLPGHKSKEFCPHCKKAGIVYYTYRSMSRVKESGVFHVYKKSKIDPGMIVCETYHAFRCPTKGATAEECAEIGIENRALTLFIYGYGGIQIRNTNAYGNPEIDRQRIKTPRGYVLANNPIPLTWSFMGYYADVFVNIESVMKATQGTPFAWSAWQNYLNDNRELNLSVLLGNLIRYFDLFAKYEATEYLAKIDMMRILQMYITNNPIGRIFNWHGKTPNDIFGVKTTKEDRRQLKEYGGDLLPQNVEYWECACKREHISILDAMKAAENIPVGMLIGLVQYAPLKKILAYIEKQKNTDTTRRATLSDYRDYLQECRYLHMDMADKRILYPKNLMQMHENLSRQVEFKRSSTQEEKWQKRRGRLAQKYSFTAGGLTIIVPEHITDLIDEGKAQHNCVGTYIERVAAGRTVVVFVRRVDDINKSYITMEITNNRIIQARTAYNRELDAEGEIFVKKFEKEVLTKLVAAEEEKRQKKLAAEVNAHSVPVSQFVEGRIRVA